MLHELLARLSLIVCRLTGGEEGQMLCARLADRYGPYSWPCSIIDFLCRQPGHCRRVWFDWTYRK